MHVLAQGFSDSLQIAISDCDCLHAYYIMFFHKASAGSAQVTAKLGKSEIFQARVARGGIEKMEVLETKCVFPHFRFFDSWLCLRAHYTIKAPPF